MVSRIIKALLHPNIRWIYNVNGEGRVTKDGVVKLKLPDAAYKLIHGKCFSWKIFGPALGNNGS